MKKYIRKRKISHLFPDFHFSIWLIQPAIKVRCQKDRFALLHWQSFPPAPLLFTDCNVHLSLSGLVDYLDTCSRKEHSHLNQPAPLQWMNCTQRINITSGFTGKRNSKLNSYSFWPFAPCPWATHKITQRPSQSVCSLKYSHSKWECCASHLWTAEPFHAH